MSEKKILTGRITKLQKYVLLNLMKENRSVGCGQFSGPEGSRKAKDIWKNVAMELNACGGANKSWKQWRKCWADWKGAVKKQYITLKRLKNKSGNLSEYDSPKEIEGLDLKVIHFFATDEVEEDNEIPDDDTPAVKSIIPVCLTKSSVCSYLPQEVLDIKLEALEEDDMHQCSETVEPSTEGNESPTDEIKEEFRTQSKQEQLLAELIAETKQVNVNLGKLIELISNKNIK